MFTSVRRYSGDKQTQQLRNIFLRLKKIGQISGVEIPVMTTKHPPYRVGRRKAVHPFGQRGYVAHPVKRFGNHLIVAEDCRNRHDHRIGIPHPYKPVALNALYEEILHAQMHSIGSRFPNPVQALVTTAERTDIFNITHY